MAKYKSSRGATPTLFSYPRRVSSFLIINLLCFLYITNHFGSSYAAPASVDTLKKPWTGIGTEETHSQMSHSSEATLVSFGVLISFVVFVILCTGGCCLNVFGKQRRDEIPTTGFANPVAELGGSTISPIDVRALEMDSIVFEPLPTLNDLTPVSNSFYNSLPRLDSSGAAVRHPRHLSVEAQSSQYASPLSAVVPTDEASVYAHDWFDEPYRSNFRRDHIEYVREVGKGWFGKVIEAEAKDIVPYARKLRVLVKVLREDATGLEQMRFLDESRLYRDANHGNVLKLLGHSIEKLPFLLIMEHCPQGDLKSFLIANVARAEILNSQGALVRMGLDIAKGLEWMSSADFIHKDLAARNCQVGSEGRIVIGDYGLAVQIFRDDYYWGSNTAIPLRWSAPETLHCTINTIQTLKVLKPSNVWTFGVVLWEILEFGKLPYYELSDDDVISRVIIDKNYTLSIPSRPALAKKGELYNIMLACWNPNPEGRPSMSAVVEKLEDIFSSFCVTEVGTPRTPNGSAVLEEEDFDKKWEAVGNRLSSSSSQPSISPGSSSAGGVGHTNNNNNNSGHNHNIIGKKKSVSFMGMTEDRLPDVHIVTPGRKDQSAGEVVQYPGGMGLTEPPQRSLRSNSSSNVESDISGTPVSSSVVKDEGQLWKACASDPEEESMELAVISEKVREKSQSVQNLMVLTHMEPGELSDPDSLVILPQSQLRAKSENNLQGDSHVINTDSDMLQNGALSSVCENGGLKSNMTTATPSSSDSGTFTCSYSAGSRRNEFEVGLKNSKSEGSSKNNETFRVPPLAESNASVERSSEESVKEGATKVESQTQVFSSLSECSSNSVAALSSQSEQKHTPSWETLECETTTSNTAAGVSFTHTVAEDVSDSSSVLARHIQHPDISFRVIPPTPSPRSPKSSTPHAAPPTPLQGVAENDESTTLRNTDVNIIESAPTSNNDSHSAATSPRIETETQKKPGVKFVLKEDESVKSSDRVRQNYRSRKTSTPMASPNTTADSSDSSVFQDSLGERTNDFSMEISEPISPIKSVKQTHNLWTSDAAAFGTDFGPSSVLLGPCDDLGLKPYQRVTTELNMLDSSSSNEFFQFSDENEPSTITSEHLTALSMQMCTTDSEGLQPPKSGFMDLFGHTGTTPTPQPQKVFYGTYSKENVTSEASPGVFSPTITANTVVKKLAFESASDCHSPFSSAVGKAEERKTISAMDGSSRTFTLNGEPGEVVESSNDITHISATPTMHTRGEFHLGNPAKTALDFDVSKEDKPTKDKFVEDIEAAAEELGSLVMTDLEEEHSEVKLIKETREDSSLQAPDDTTVQLQTKKAFEMSLDETNSSTATEGEIDGTPGKDGDETQVEYVELPDSSSRVSQFEPDNSRTVLYPGESDCEVEDDDKEDTESICREFVPSKWNQNLAPVKPAIKSPEQHKSQVDTPDCASAEKTALKKSVSFERKKTQLVYEYPPPPVQSDSDDEEKIQSRPLRTGGQIHASLDWELQPDELENPDILQDDWEDEEVPKRNDNPIDMYRISGFDNFQVRASDRPFDFRVPPPPRLSTAESSSPSFLPPSSSSNPFNIPPLSDTSTLGELRHTRGRLKLDLAKGEASILDNDAFNSNTKITTGKPQQIDSGVGSSTNVSPFNNCDNSGKV